MVVISRSDYVIVSILYALNPNDYYEPTVYQERNGNTIAVNPLPNYALNFSAMLYYGPNVALGAVIPPTYGTSLPSNPADGQEAILVDSLTNPTYQWRFRYNAGSSSAYKWEFIGGTSLYSEVLATQTATGVNVWIDMPTVGPQVTVPRAGVYEWIAAAGISATVGGSCGLGMSFGGGTPAAGNSGYVVAAAPYVMATIIGQQTISAGSVAKLQYWANPGNPAVQVRKLWVRPWAVS